MYLQTVSCKPFHGDGGKVDDGGEGGEHLHEADHLAHRHRRVQPEQVLNFKSSTSLLKNAVLKAFLRCTIFWADSLLLYWICLCSKFPANTQTLDDFLSLSNRKFEISISSCLYVCKKIGSFIELTMQQKYHWEKGETIRICKVVVIILNIPQNCFILF